MSDQSGWREVDEFRVAQLEDTFIGGQFGQTAMKMPSVLHGTMDSAPSSLQVKPHHVMPVNQKGQGSGALTLSHACVFKHGLLG